MWKGTSDIHSTWAEIILGSTELKKSFLKNKRGLFEKGGGKISWH